MSGVRPPLKMGCHVAATSGSPSAMDTDWLVFRVCFPRQYGHPERTNGLASFSPGFHSLTLARIERTTAHPCRGPLCVFGESRPPSSPLSWRSAFPPVVWWPLSDHGRCYLHLEVVAELPQSLCRARVLEEDSIDVERINFAKLVLEAWDEGLWARAPRANLCGTCRDNLFVLLTMLHATNGDLDWGIHREFGNTIRALAMKGWQYCALAGNARNCRRQVNATADERACECGQPVHAGRCLVGAVSC